ncbi:large T-antigen [Bat mastadenovirus WIV12]|uniref:E1B 55 kDa protein n=1 Tax=Bat mastadenovirus WIV12 TaxID=1788434 RepID=A0A1B0UI02_9ADEN|nr:large T-antigen [Bat mastadenovirus WIV12]AMB43145.1 large T-antigen [Bat mastadenovirus WIV12]
MAGLHEDVVERESVMIPRGPTHRVPLESIPFQQILDETERQPINLRRLCMEYSFEEIATYVMQPHDNWTEMIDTHVKIALNPGIIYKISAPVIIGRECYIIGNGATVEIDCAHSAVFIVRKDRFNPNIRNLSGVVFQNVKFLHNMYESGQGILFQVTKKTTFHNCYFFGFNHTCVIAYEQVIMRSCVFEACFRGVCLYHNDTPYFGTSRIVQCYFKRCAIGIIAKAFIKICNNVSQETYCMALLFNGARFTHNKILTPYTAETFAQRYVTCRDGIVVPLQTVHISGNHRVKWPVLKDNFFHRCSLFLGNRRGATMFKNCSFFRTQIFVEPEVGNKVSFSSIYGLDLSIFKMIRMATDAMETESCECGAVHRHHRFMFGDITHEVLPNPRLVSCQTLEYSSASDSGGLNINFGRGVKRYITTCIFIVFYYFSD